MDDATRAALSALQGQTIRSISFGERDDRDRLTFETTEGQRVTIESHDGYEYCSWLTAEFGGAGKPLHPPADASNRGGRT